MNPSNLPPGVTNRIIEEQAGAFLVKCDECNGNGFLKEDDGEIKQCPKCEGTGLTDKNEQ